jgi:hypothetical protein
MGFAELLGYSEPPNPEEEGAVEDWVDSVVGTFTDNLKLTTKAREHKRAGDEA